MTNIAEKLKDAPMGTKLYSPICGECTLDSVSPYSISVKDCTGTLRTFDAYGRFYPMLGECTLFPSKDKWHWDNFTIKKEYNFKPFDKVIVRDRGIYDSKWLISFFSHYDSNNEKFPYVCVNDCRYNYCIPYNEETSKLIGTTDEYKD